MNIVDAKKLFGKNFIGPDELKKINKVFHFDDIFNKIPSIEFSDLILEKNSGSSILVLGVPFHKDGSKITLKTLRGIFGIDPAKNEPCFYNQDWYINQNFVEQNLENQWYLINKNVSTGSRGKYPEDLLSDMPNGEVFPSAILTAFAFFTNYILNKEILWENDFVWCSDTDDNGDRIYTGRYVDPTGKNKKGFNIHRHLRIRQCYGLASQFNN